MVYIVSRRKTDFVEVDFLCGNPITDADKCSRLIILSRKSGKRVQSYLGIFTPSLCLGGRSHEAYSSSFVYVCMYVSVCRQDFSSLAEN